MVLQMEDGAGDWTSEWYMDVPLVTCAERCVFVVWQHPGNTIRRHGPIVGATESATV